MAINVTYGSNTGTIQDFLSGLSSFFAQPNHQYAGSFSNQSGSYPGAISGDQWGVSSWNPVSGINSYSFVADAAGSNKLSYTGAAGHQLSGPLDSLEFGATYLANGSGQYYVPSPDLTISNLNSVLNGTTDTHNIVWGLMGGNTTPLETKLDSYSLNITGSTGNDVISGYSQDDTLTGNGGNDTFLFELFGSSTTFGNDTITDYNLGDVIDINIAGATYSVSGTSTSLVTVLDASSNLLGTITVGVPPADLVFV